MRLFSLKVVKYAFCLIIICSLQAIVRSDGEGFEDLFSNDSNVFEWSEFDHIHAFMNLKTYTYHIIDVKNRMIAIGFPMNNSLFFINTLSGTVYYSLDIKSQLGIIGRPLDDVWASLENKSGSSAEQAYYEHVDQLEPIFRSVAWSHRDFDIQGDIEAVKTYCDLQESALRGFFQGGGQAVMDRTKDFFWPLNVCRSLAIVLENIDGGLAGLDLNMDPEHILKAIDGKEAVKKMLKQLRESNVFRIDDNDDASLINRVKRAIGCFYEGYTDMEFQNAAEEILHDS